MEAKMDFLHSPSNFCCELEKRSNCARLFEKEPWNLSRTLLLQEKQKHEGFIDLHIKVQTFCTITQKGPISKLRAKRAKFML